MLIANELILFYEHKIIHIAYDNLFAGKQVAAVFLDVKKTFDSVPHHQLIRALHSIGIQGPLLNWLRGYLTSRSQQVILDGVAASSPIAVTSGVPQGSILVL